MGSVCIDGAPGMIGHRYGFVALMKQVAPHIVLNHCTIYKYALACETLPLELKSVLDSVVKAVNFIRGRAINSDCSKHFATTFGKEHQCLFSHRNAMVIAKCSPVLQNLSPKLPCFFVSMGQWNLLHYLIKLDSN